MVDSIKKAYWKQRMLDKTNSQVKSLNDFEKFILDTYRRNYDLDLRKVNESFQIIASGFGSLIRIIKEEPELTKEGVPDLSKVKPT